MLEEDLEEHIQEKLAGGEARFDIDRELIEAGYDPADIDDAWEQIKLRARPKRYWQPWRVMGMFGVFLIFVGFLNYRNDEIAVLIVVGAILFMGAIAVRYFEAERAER